MGGNRRGRFECYTIKPMGTHTDTGSALPAEQYINEHIANVIVKEVA